MQLSRRLQGVFAMIVLVAACPVAADQTVFDSEGRIAKVIYDDGSETRLSYDTEGRLILVEHSDGTTVCTEYDSAGVAESSDC